VAYYGHLPSFCGSDGAACCVGTAIIENVPVRISYCHSGWTCNDGTCNRAPPPVPCGDVGQECCRDADSYDTQYDSCNDFQNTVCFPWLGEHGTCEACGNIGEPSCDGGPHTPFGSGRCNAGRVERNRTCVACGQPGGPCCLGSASCNDGSSCQSTQGFTCTTLCGVEGGPPCSNFSCKGDLHTTLDPNGNGLICTSSCGHANQLACCTQYPVSGGVSSRYRCFDHSMLDATPGPPIAENCMCVANAQTNQETDVSDNSGFCISATPPRGDIPDPPDCEGKCGTLP